MYEDSISKDFKSLRITFIWDTVTSYFPWNLETLSENTDNIAHSAKGKK